jgi:hypothetical protein
MKPDLLILMLEVSIFDKDRRKAGETGVIWTIRFDCFVTEVAYHVAHPFDEVILWC